jgi:hypothetical protein
MMLPVWIVAGAVCFLGAATMFHQCVASPWLIIAFWFVFLVAFFVLGLFV